MIEEYRTLAQVARDIPVKTSPQSLWRWCREGLQVKSGDRIHLKHIRCGRRILVADKDVNDFFDELKAADAAYFRLRSSSRNPIQLPVPRTDRQRTEAAETAHRKLQDLGM